MNSNVFVSVIIPAHNSEEYLEEVLRALRSQSYPKEFYEIIVVDNDSIDATPAIGKAHADVYDLYKGKPVGRVRNRGVELAKGKFLLFLDSDCIAPSDWIEKCVNLLSDNSDTIYGGGILLRDKPYFIEKYWLLNSSEGGLLPKQLIGAAIAIRKEHFLSINGFSKELTAGEDSQLHKDLEKNNYKVKITRDISVVHLGNATSILSFVKRQIWHSEGYSMRLSKVAREPVFIFMCVFFLLHVSFLLNCSYFSVSVFSIIMLVAIRSIHRIKSSNNISNIKYLFPVMSLDYLYFWGRTIGFFKGLLNRIFTKN